MLPSTPNNHMQVLGDVIQTSATDGMRAQGHRVGVHYLGTSHGRTTIRSTMAKGKF